MKFSRKRLLLMCAVLFAVLYAGLLWQRYSITHPSPERLLRISADSVNKMCPVMIDSDTRLDNEAMLENKTFAYNYTLVHFSKAHINVDSMKDAMGKRIVAGVSTDKDLQYHRNHEIIFNYNYKDKDGIPMFTVTVSPEQYKAYK